MMLHIHLLLMMLSIHLLLMVHRHSAHDRRLRVVFLFLHPGLVSFSVLIVAVKIFCLVFVPSSPGFLTAFLPWPPCSAIFPGFVFTLSRSRCACSAIGLSRPDPPAPTPSPLPCAFSLVERLDRFLVRFPLASSKRGNFCLWLPPAGDPAVPTWGHFVGVGHRFLCSAFGCAFIPPFPPLKLVRLAFTFLANELLT